MKQILFSLQLIPFSRKRGSLHVFFLFLLLLLAFHSERVSATHAAGGDITYTWVSGNTYQVTATFYRDCSGIAAPTQMEIDYISVSCGLSGFVNASQIPPSGTEIGYPCPYSTVCSGGTSPGYQQYIYQANVTLPAACSDWVLSFQPAAGSGQTLGRNCSITTLSSPCTTDLYVEATLNNLNFSNNNSPQFSTIPVSFICAGQSFNFNNGVTQADGDSLNFELIDAKSSSTTTVTYLDSLSGINPLLPIGCVSINSSTGDLTINTNILQFGVIAILVSEYRNGVLVGSVIRDMQFIVQPCSNNLPTLSGINGGNIYSDTVCAGNVVSFTINSNDLDSNQIDTMTWDNGISFPATFTSSGSPHPTGTFSWVTSASDGRSLPYIFTVTVTDNNCPNKGISVHSFSIYILSPPVINITPPAASICSGQNTTTLSASGGYSYLWSPSSGLSSSNISNPTANPLTSTTYTVIGTNASGCTNTSSITVTVNPIPTITASPSSPILCNGQSVSLMAGGGNTYSWSPSTGLSSAVVSNPIGNPSSSTTYTVIGTDGNGCTNTKSVTVTVNPLPSINVSPSAPIICNNESVSLTASGGTTYTWSPSTGLSAITGTTVSANPSSNTTYTVTGTDGNGCTNTKSVTVTVNPLTVIGVNPTAPILCNGQSVSITASGGTTYSWSPSTGLSATSGATVSANPSSSTTYTITETDGNGCTNTKSLTVTVNPLPVISVGPTTPVLCDGQSVSLTASGGNTYTWSPSSGLSSTEGTTVSANPSGTATYIVTGTDGNGCTNTKSVTVTVNPLPVIIVSPSAPILCNGQSVSLTAGGGNTYIWSPSAGLSATTGTIVSANPSSTATYIVTGTDGNGCTNTGSVTVTVNPLPVVSVSPSAPVLCNGQSTSLTASGGITYTWNPSIGLSSGSGSIVSANPTATTTYTVTGTNGNGCTNTSSVTVTINPKPTITINPTAPILCNGQSVLLTAGGGNTYTWSPSLGLSVTTGATVSANPSSTMDYTVTGMDANGCTNTKDVIVTVNPLPTITVNPSAPALCNGASESLTAEGGVTYVWSPGTGLSATTGSTISANPSSTSTYIVIGTDANGCTNTGSVTVTVNSTPTIIINPATPVLCNGQSLSLTAGGADTYVWSPSTGLSATTEATVSANPSSTTTYIVTGTEAGGCTNTKTVTVTVNPLPVIIVSPSSPILCNGQSVSLDATGGNTYAWSPATGLSSGSGTTVSASPTSTTTYVVTGTDGNNCMNTASVTIIINPLPTIAVSPSAPILCNGQSVLLTAEGGNTYLWNPTTGLSSGSGADVSTNPTTTTIYTVIGIDGNGCTNTGTTTVTVNPLPDIIASPTSTVLCNGQSVSLTAGGGNAYAWSPSTGLSSESGSTVSTNPNTTTSYTVTGTDGNGCTNTASITVTINPTPKITANPASPILCNGQFVSLTAGGGSTYEWSPTTGLSLGSGSTVSANPTSTITYIVTGTDGNGCTNTASVTVTINPTPTITVSPSAPILCNGQSVLLTAGGGNTYVWGPTTGLSSGSGSSVSANPNATEIYIVTGSDGNGCTSTGSVTVSVNPLPVVIVSPNAPALCNGQSMSLTASGGSTYTWSPATGLSSGSGSIVSSNPTSTTTYIVTGTNGNGCTSTSSATVSVNALPVISVSPVAPMLCNGQSVSLTASGANTYTWSPDTGLSSGSGTTVSADPSASTTYVVTGTDGNGCSSTSSVTVTVNPLPVVTVAPIAPAICIGQSVSLTASGGVTYSWSPIAGLSSGGGTTVSANPTTTTVYTVTGTDGNGCSSTASATATVNPLPVVNAGPDANICPNDSAQLIVTGPPPGSTYTWTPSTNLSCRNCSNPYASPQSTTTYIVSVTTLAGCSAQDTVSVIVTSLSVTVSHDTTICGDISVQLHASGGSNYVWTPSTGLNNANIADPLASPTDTTVYTVTVTSGSCSSTASVSINVFATVPTPSIIESSDTLSCTFNPIYTAYQWYFNSTIIPNATNSYYVATENGNYNVIVFDENGCSISVGINVILGVQDQFNCDLLSLYPNPASELLTVLFLSPHSGETLKVSIMNVLGEIILEERLKWNNEVRVNIRELPVGIYFLQLRTDNGTVVRRFLKE